MWQKRASWKPAEEQLFPLVISPISKKTSDYRRNKNGGEQIATVEH
jgi:hypothetical protein